MAAGDRLDISRQPACQPMAFQVDAAAAVTVEITLPATYRKIVVRMDSDGWWSTEGEHAAAINTAYRFPLDGNVSTDLFDGDKIPITSRPVRLLVKNDTLSALGWIYWM